MALRKVNRCPLAEILFNDPAPKCDSSKNRHIRRFKLLEFLATRTFVLKNGTRILASRELFGWLLDDLLEADIQALDSNAENPAGENSHAGIQETIRCQA